MHLVGFCDKNMIFCFLHYLRLQNFNDSDLNGLLILKSTYETVVTWKMAA